jgi:hypothetical protein
MISFFGSFILGLLSAFLYEWIAINQIKVEALYFSGYRMHHSLYGLLSVAVFAVTKKHFFLGFGLGIIIQHTVTDGFWFITK